MKLEQEEIIRKDDGNNIFSQQYPQTANLKAD